MIIKWHGQSCFTIEGDKATIVIDPFDEEIGLKLPKLSADIVLSTHEHADHSNVAAVKGKESENPFVVNGPGEYEVKETFVYGIGSFHDASQGSERGTNTIYRIEIDGISIAHLGDLGHLLEDKQLENLEGVDILMIPVGGNYTIDGKTATKIISQMEPRIVIPMHYKIKGLNEKIEGLDGFCKEIGVCPPNTVDKLKIVKKDLPQEDLQVVTMEP